MALLQVLSVAFFLLTTSVLADSCVSKPCGSDYQITSWNPVREGSYSVYYYEVKTDGCVGVVFTDVLLQTSLTCQNCVTIKCYNSNWDVVSCKYSPSWVTSDSFLKSKGISVTSGLKWVLPQSTSLRFSLSVNPSTTTSATGKIYTKGNSWTTCTVTTPVCNCNVCPACPNACYRSGSGTYPNCACTTCTNCTSNTYETQPCSASSNRVCSPCTACVNGQYQTVPCSQSSNRQCTSCTQCTANMTYESVPCSGSTNRQCLPCRQCVNGQYMSLPCTTNQNRQCTNCTQCVAGVTYQNVTCTGSTNRQCLPCRQCVAGQYVSLPCTTTQNSQCTTCTQCVAGVTYENVTCGGSTNRQCLPCRQCVNGQYQTLPCTTTQNRQCTTCTPCLAGQIEVSPCNATQNRVCANCTTCVNGYHETAPCGTPSRQCLPCRQCVDGQYQVLPCTSTQDRNCSTCSVCVEGQYQTAPCTTTSDTQCTDCTPCGPGQIEVSPCTSTSDRVCRNCTECENGFYEVTPCTDTTDRTCQRCSNCSANEQVLYPCNATNDVVCVPCPECANCDLIPNSHLDNNGLNCTCNEGYTQQNTETGFVCVPTACCGDCQACGFNRSVPCYNNDATLCDYSCRLSDVCTAGTTPADTGYSIAYLGVTYDADCCAAGTTCSCFTYQVASSLVNLESFVLGVSCSLALCDPLIAPPCLSTVLRDGVPVDQTGVVVAVGASDPNIGVSGIVLQGLNINQDFANITFVFNGFYNESSIPIIVGAEGALAGSEQRACLVSNLGGPDCVDCTTNPTAVQALKTLMAVPKSTSGKGSLFTGRKIRQ